MILWNLRNILEHLFHRHLRWLLLYFWTKIKMKKYNHRLHIHRKTLVIVSILVQLQAWGLTLKRTVLRKRDSILSVFCEICEVLQNLICTEESWATASNSSNISETPLALLAINQLSRSWLGPPLGAIRKQFTMFVSKIFKITKAEGNNFCGWGWRNKQKRVFSKSSHPEVFCKKASWKIW